jgi:sRNA-binding regulator protein Hfq
MLTRVLRYEKIAISMLNNFFINGFRAKNSIARVYEVILKESRNVLIFDL